MGSLIVLKTKNSMTSLDVRLIRKEMEVLTGSYAEKAYGFSPFSLRFNLQRSKKELLLIDDLFLTLTDRIEHDEKEGMSDFASAVRRKFDNSRVTGIEQAGFDRIIRIKFSRPEGAEIVFELFGKGNALIVENGIVTSALKFDRRGRFETKPGTSYELPQSRFNPLPPDAEALRKLLETSRGDTVRTLATIAGLGPDMSEEVCARAEVDRGRKPSELSDRDVKELADKIGEIIDSADTHPSPYVYYQDGCAVQFTPVPFVIFSDLEGRPFDSISGAIVEFITNRKREVKGEDDDKRARLIRRQMEAIEKLRTERDSAKRFAQSTYEKYADFEKIVNAIREGSATGYSYRRLNRDRAILEVEGVEYDFNPNDEMHKIVSSIYGTVKETERKLKRAQEALDEIERQKTKKAETPHRPVIRKSSKRFWFEDYRWFVSSEGCLVVGGRDARTNDRLISRHMSADDRYVHADIYGAPSTVVKWNAAATEITLEEACIFAVCFSRAWNSKIGSAPAYWVLPEQVSKTPQTGEFLPRGAFVIRGKRNYFPKLPLLLAIGTITYEGEIRTVCGPLRAMEANAQKFIRLIPGSRTKEQIASLLSEALGVSRDSIVSALPPGNSDLEGTITFRETKQ
jgi:predicted ribosome quality control (RQC) complex YloA/Tae2 family protein